jgi:uncharacterized membrane protein
MRNYIAIVFNDTGSAYEALHALWVLDSIGDVTVHGTAVVHRDDWGQFTVDTKETQPGLATAIGVGIGALMGALAGPVGMAAGAASGAAIGAGADLMRAGDRDQAGSEAAFVLGNGQSAVIADVSEDSTEWIDDRMLELGGIVFRRAKSDMQDDEWFDDYYIPYSYLYPYEYIPSDID